jgi:para-aminobenzoate synthetase
MRVSSRAVEVATDPEVVFAALLAGEEHAFWLDSAHPGADARFSFMGAPGPHGFLATHRVGEGEPVFEYLERELERLRPEQLPSLPFDFACGFVGYLGYELKAECGGEAAHRAETPDAALLFADRVIAFDHAEGATHLVALTEGSDERWLDETEAALRLLANKPTYRGDNSPTNGGDAGIAGLDAEWRRSRGRYLADVERCGEFLRAGDSYEICLTNRATVAAEADPFALYAALRRVNPAPYGALLRLGELSVLSSSPERFLRIEPDGGIEARPIKGTAALGATPAEDERIAAELAADPKSRAENVTIVDLLRNDLGRVCEFGSVEVPALLEVETYETVHQLVSTVRGRLCPGVGPAAAVRACFPPGSMTGAPKLRTMEILDQLEGGARGVYSGAIGCFGLGGGADLSVAIRTIVLAEGVASVGAGGAIVVDSDPEAEYEEVLLKARAPLRALGDYRRMTESESMPRVTPRKSSSSGAAAARAG